MTGSDRERTPSFVDVSKVSEISGLWRSFRQALADLGKDEIEVGLFLSIANKEMLRFQEHLLRLGLDVDDIRNPQVVSLPADMRPPTAPETVRLDPRDFLHKAMHAYIVMLDNQNTIPEWAADSLCRLVTGEADSKRRLYTEDEDFIIELRRAVMLNGINVPTDRGDVLDRSLVVELERRGQ
jgi:hypothetical protein